MKAVRVRIPLLFCLAASLLTAAGCAVGGKSFAIDSNSRIPFFGLELKERKKKSGAPTYNSISRGEQDRSFLQAATSGGMRIHPGERPVAEGETVVIDAPVLNGRPAQRPRDVPLLRESIPLPVSSSRRVTESRISDISSADFQ